jgi:peptidoglycan/xylan/chitin deacetylase (PgdA/CDA1 family)
MLASLRTALFSSVVAIALLGSSASAASFEGLATRVQRTPVYSTCTQDGRVAVTFDDGPWNFEPHLLDELDRYGAKASFFLNGNN